MNDSIPQDTIPLKRCLTCPEGQQWHPATTEFFFKSSVNKDGLRSQCKACRKIAQRAYEQRPEVQIKRQEHERSPKRKEQMRALRQRSQEKLLKQSRTRHLRNTYNITDNNYQNMFTQQMGVCAICGKPESHISRRSGKVQELTVDHCHLTGLVRELLCNDCNFLIAYGHDDTEILRKAIAYLEKHSM